MVFKACTDTVVPCCRYVNTVVQNTTIVACQCAIIESNLWTNNRIFSHTMEIVYVDIQTTSQRSEVETYISFFYAFPLKVTEIAVILVTRRDIISVNTRKTVTC